MKAGLRLIAVWTLLNGLLLAGLAMLHIDFERPSGEAFRPELAALSAILALPIMVGGIQLWRLRNAGRLLSVTYYIIVTPALIVASARGVTPSRPVVPIVAGVIAIIVLLLPKARVLCKGGVGGTNSGSV